MCSTNFNQEHIDKINCILEFVLKNPYSQLYKEKYKKQNIHKINNYSEFTKLPFLIKEEFKDLELNEITFVDEREIKYYATSGGTTSGTPTIIPHASYNHEQLGRRYYNENIFVKHGVRNVMTLLVPNSGPLLRVMRMQKQHTVLIPGDIYNFPLMAMTAKEIGIQGIITSPSRLNEFIECLERVNFDFSQIKWISLGHEYFSSSMLSRFKSKLPNAIFNIHYGASEIGGARGYQCDHLAKTNCPQIFHPTPAIIEIINEKGETLPLGQTGEIVHTDNEIKAFPLIRYRLGDIGSLEQCPCTCGNNFRLTLQGRSSSDFIQVDQFTISSDSIARSLEQINEFIDGRFQLHIYKETVNNENKIQLEVHLKLKDAYSKKKEDALFKQTIAEKIAQKLFLSKNQTVKSLTNSKKIHPLSAVFTESWPTNQKAKHIVTHF